MKKEPTQRDQAMQETEGTTVTEESGVPSPPGDGGAEDSGIEPACAGCFACTNCIGATTPS